MRRLAASALALLILLAPAAARHRRHHDGHGGGDGASVGLPERGLMPEGPALPPGLYTLVILAPTLDPRLAIDEQVQKVCYSAADSAAHANIVMPPAERAACKQESLAIGDDLAFDDFCDDGYHRLRVFRIADASYGGTYRFVAKAKGGLLDHSGLMLEPAVQLRREGDCPNASAASPPAR